MEGGDEEWVMKMMKEEVGRKQWIATNSPEDRLFKQKREGDMK